MNDNFLYTISINQLACVKNGLSGKVDLVDLAIFYCVYHLMNSPHKITAFIDGVEYTEIRQSIIESQLPILKIGTKRTFINRMNNLIDLGLIERYSLNPKENRSLYKRGKNFSILTYCDAMKNNSQGMKTDSDGVNHNDQNLCKSIHTPMKNDSHNNNIIYNNINNKIDIGEKEISAPCVAPKKQEDLIEKRKKRERDFYDSLTVYLDTYGKEMLRDFFNYWSEPNKSGSKMKFEMQKTWDTARRLVTWSNNESKYGRSKMSAGGKYAGNKEASRNALADTARAVLEQYKGQEL